MNLECDLKGTTQATCSGYSSFKSGYSLGNYVGPTEVTWTSTFTGSEVAWAVITITDKIEVQTNGLTDLTATAMETPESSVTADEIAPHGFPSDDSIFPIQTGAPDKESTAVGRRRNGEGAWAVVAAAVGAAVLTGVTS